MVTEKLLACGALLFVYVGLNASSRPMCTGNDSINVLEEIYSRGVLNIGITADYQPFSYYDAGQLRGIDVELGENLAQQLGMRVEWVPTTWPTLRADLAANKFDIAMGGVSVTNERAKSGCFGPTYFVTGKTVIARCDKAAQFVDLAGVDRDGVRVIVNPGGTNERFVRRNIHRATVVLHPDNATIFAALAEGQADLMITDGVEAQRMVLEYPALCVPAPDTFFELMPKAFYMPKDAVWHAWVSHWLEASQEDGSFATILERYLPEQRDPDVTPQPPVPEEPAAPANP